MKIKNILSTLCLLPISIYLIGFIASNNQMVTISFDPFSQSSSMLNLPLCLGLIASLVLGFIIASLLSWLNSFPHKRELKKLRKLQNVKILDATKE